MKFQLALPIPPLREGTSWTGVSLLNWIVKRADPQMRAALVQMRDSAGGDQFRAIFNAKAAELNARFAARGHAVADPEAINPSPGPETLQ